MLELGEKLLDGIEIGTVGRREEQMGPGLADGAAGGLALVAAEVVEDDDVALGQRGCEHLFGVELKKSSPLIGPSMTSGASMRLHLSAPMKVRVFQWPCGV